jgi:hypothetical protein
MTTFVLGKISPAVALVAASAFALLSSAGTVARAQGGYDPVLTTIEVRQLVTSTAPRDQAKLAAHFTALAARHAAEAATHRTMAKAYPGNPRGGGREMLVHCQHLAALESKIATTLRELATHHAALASGAASTVPAGGAKYQAGAGAHQPSDAELAALAATAASTADHRTLQDYFLTLATRGEAEAGEHAALAASYRTTKTVAAMAPHCDRLAQEIRAVAREARAAASMHGTLAASATAK